MIKAETKKTGMKEELKDLVAPLTNWYTGATAVEKSSLSKFHLLDDQLKELKRFLETMFANEVQADDFTADEIKAVRMFYLHIDELDLWHVMISPKTVKSISTSENIDLKRLKNMAKELLDMLKGKIDPRVIIDRK